MRRKASPTFPKMENLRLLDRLITLSTGLLLLGLTVSGVALYTQMSENRNEEKTALEFQQIAENE